MVVNGDTLPVDDVCRDLRILLDGWHTGARERLALRGYRYCVAILKRSGSGSRNGIDEHDVQEAANLAVAELLRATSDGEGRPRLVQLDRQLSKVLERRRCDRAGEGTGSVARRVCCQCLEEAFDTILASTAHQRYFAALKRSHPEINRILILLKRHIETHPGLTRFKVGRTSFVGRTGVVTRVGPATSREVLTRVLGVVAGDVGASLDTLARFFAEGREGVHAYLLDVARVMEECRRSVYREDAIRAPGGNSPTRTLHDREVREIVFRTARELRAADLVSHPGWRLPPPLEDAFVNAGAEVVALLLGVGLPELDGVPQAGIFLHHASGLTREDYQRDHCQRLDYFVLRLKKKLAEELIDED